MRKNMLPCLPNVLPWNKLWLDGKIEHKYRNWYLHYRGWLLLYNSKHRIDRDACENFSEEYDSSVDLSSEPRGCIVGIVRLTDWRDVIGDAGIEWELSIDQRFTFQKPIPFTPPKGAVKIFYVPTRVASKALKQVGIDPKGL